MLVKALLFWNVFKSEMASLSSFDTSELINTSSTKMLKRFLLNGGHEELRFLEKEEFHHQL